MRKIKNLLTPAFMSTRLTAILTILFVLVSVTATAFMQEEKKQTKEQPTRPAQTQQPQGESKPEVNVALPAEQEKEEPAPQAVQNLNSATPVEQSADVTGVRLVATGKSAPVVPNAVSATTYPLTTTTGVALEDTSSATQLMGSGQDDTASLVFNMGIEFWFNGVRYTTFSAQSNGMMRLGSTVVSTTFSNALASSSDNPKISPYWDDQTTGSNGYVRAIVIGSAPNRKLVVEWKTNTRVDGTSVTAVTDKVYQAWLFETTGKIQFVYGSIPAGVSYSTGIVDGTAIFASVTTSTDTANYATANDANATAIASGKSYTFTPLIPAVPTNLTFTSVTQSGLTLNWTDNATNELGYPVYLSTDSVNYSFIGQVAANATSASVTGLNPGTTYFFQIYAVTEGALSQPALSGSRTTTAATLSGTKTICPSGCDYATLTAANTDIQSKGLAGPLTLELQSTYVSTSETFPILFNKAPGTNTTNTITVVPSASATNLTITSANTTATVDLNGAANVIFDGRPGGTGTSKQLTIDNTSTSGVTIRYINDATNDTVKYCTIKGVNTSVGAAGVIFFSTTTGANGNDNNTIDNCDVRDGATTPTNSIFSSGTTTTTATNNSGNTISNSNIFNFYNSTSTSNGGVGINISSGTTDWNITGNSFYQTATRTTFGAGSTVNGILISNSSGNNIVITGNFIGGTAPQCGGTAWTINSATTTIFRGVQATVGTTTATSLQGNTVQNISITTTSASTAQSAFSLVTGSFNVGNITGNTIGSQGTTGSITFSTSGSSAIFSAILAGNGTPGAINISNNTMGGIAVSSSGATGISVRGIGFQGAATSYTINNNIIGSTTTANSFTNSANNSLIGIFGSATTTSPVNSIANNIVANLNGSGGGTSTQVIGILSQGSTGGAYSTTGNTVRNLSTNSTNTAATSGASVVGIDHTASTTAGETVSQNVVHSLSNTAATAAISVTAIFYSGPSTGTNVVDRNFVHSLSTTSTGAAVLNGIYDFNGSSTLRNNMVRLGIDASGNSLTSGALAINGILTDTLSSLTNNYYFNSVFIGGTGVTAGTATTNAFKRIASETSDVRNNIFVNNRSNSTGTGKHYLINVAATTTLTSDFNDFFFNGTGAVFGVVGATDSATFANWKTNTSKDTNSLFSDPQYSNATANSTNINLHVLSASPASNMGTTIAGQTNDFDGQTRNSPPDIGADEINGDTFQFSSASYLVNEAAGTVTITVTRAGDATAATSVSYATSNGTATAGSDYTTTSGSLPFAAFQTTNTFTVPITNDTLYEGSTAETFNVTLSGATIGTPNAAVVSIVDNDNAPTISINNVSVNETGGNAVFTVTQSAASALNTTFTYSTANVTAIAGSDYTGATNVAGTITAGNTTTTISIPITNDGIYEGPETFTVTLSSPANATIAAGTGTGTITDIAPTISINNVTVSEAGGNAVFTVTQSGVSALNTTFQYSTANGTATAGSDYTGATNVAGSITAGNTTTTISIPITEDALYEGNETFTVTLSNPTNATIATGTGTGTITDNDNPPATLVVTKTADTNGTCLTGNCSLREAINAANAVPGDGNTISFNIPNTDPGLAGGVFVITPTSQLPDITGTGTVIDGTSQTAFGGDTNAAGPEIQLSGAFISTQPVPLNFVDGLRMSGANGTVKGLIINGFNTTGFANRGILISGAAATGNVVQGNYIGTDAAGTAAVGNGDGVMIQNGATNNIIGGSLAGEGNVISGNTFRGVAMQGATTGNSVRGNLIGTNSAGTAALGNTGNGIEISGGSNSNTIGGTGAGARNIISGNGGNGIQIGGGAAVTSTLVQGNYIGTNLSGTAALSNPGGGVRISDGANNNSVGGASAGARNVISGNGAGVQITGTNSNNNTVRGNYIGTDATGALAVGNAEAGVSLSDAAANNSIGGAAAGEGNVISGNTGSFGTPAGVSIRDANTSGNSVRGNLIGVAADATSALGNTGGGTGGNPGVLIFAGAQNNTIGGTAAGEANIIANNTGDGLRLIDAATTGNNIRGNSIYDNGVNPNPKLGINLVASGENPALGLVTANDAQDTDPGPNTLQNFPVITSAVTGSTTVGGTLNSTPGAAFTIDVYSNTACDPSGNGEGKSYLGSITTGTTDGNGDVVFTVNVPALAGGFITATATDAAGNTSEFSQCYAVAVPVLKYRSIASGNWNNTATWETSPDGITWSPAATTPTAATADTITVRSPHIVTVTADVNADQLTIDSGGTINVNSGVTFTISDGTGTDMIINGTVSTAGTITDNGQVQVNNVLQINEGGFPGGGVGTYAYDQTNGVLVFNNSTGPYGVGNNNYWPTTNGPQNVTVAGAGGIQMNVARTVNGLFQYGGGVSGAGNLTLNGTSQVNTGGFTSGSPTYGPASLLKYNTGGSYGRNGEWLPGAVSGAGYPNNVQLSNSTTLDLPNGSSGVSFQMAGTLTIDAGSTMNLNGSPAMTQPLNVLGSVGINGTLSLSTALGGDIRVGGDWTRSATGTFTPNGRAVFFNGSTTQTITRTGAGSETFNYLIVDKTAGTLRFNNSPATSVNVNATTGNVLQLLNAGGIDLAGNTLTLQNNGGSILVSGGARNISDPSNFNGHLVFSGSKSVASAGGGTLNVNDNVFVHLQAAVDFGAALTTVNSQFIREMTGSVTNPPTYTANSTLVYDVATNGFVGRGPEWSATSGPGYPNHVLIKNNSFIDLGAGGPATARQLAGNLTINGGGELSMAATPMTAALSVLGNVTIDSGGVLTLSSLSGGDLKLQGNYTNNGLFTNNSRAVFFEGGATQTLFDTSGTAAMPYVIVNKTGGTVQLNSNLTTNGPGGGNSITFSNATSTLTLNGRTLTLGSLIGTTPAGAGFIGDNSANLVLQDGGAPGPMGTLRFVTGSENLQSLTLNRTGAGGNVTLGSNLNINGAANALTLIAGILKTDTNTLRMGGNATSNGSASSYVTGKMTKVYDAVPKNFTFDLGTTGGTTDGYTPASVDAQATSATGEVTATVTNAHHPSLTGSSLQRYWSLTNNGLTLANLSFTYLDGDLPASPPEAALVTYKIDGPTATTPVGSAVVAATNQITMTGATSFSDWTAGAINAPTAVRLASFDAISDEGGVLLRWQTGREVSNLGFNLYREDGRGRTRVTPSIIAGSALMAGPQTTLTAGQSYSWWDAQGQPGSRYYLEDIDLNGKRNSYGPVSTVAGKLGRDASGNRSALLGELRPQSNTATASAEQGRPATLNEQATSAASGRKSLTTESDQLQQQRAIAAGQAVKLQVRENGWYRVSQPALLAAGLDPNANRNMLQLYADGVEQAMLIRNDSDRPLTPGEAIEFYGTGLNTTGSDTHTYWLVAATEPGKRLNVTAIGVASPKNLSTQGFAYTIERRDRVVFFPALHNGAAENFFGPVISTTAATQTLDVRGLDATATAAATLAITLQGATADQHQVRVRLNGADLGVVSFNAQEHPTTSINVPQSALVEGQNTVSLSAENGDTDVSLVDTVRLTYTHQYRAENNLLTFSTPIGKDVEVSGFTSQGVSVFDITDPNDVHQVNVRLQRQGPGYALTVPGSDTEQRTMIALTDDGAQQVTGLSANQPSTLTGSDQPGADFVIITHGDFRQSVEPLAQLRRGQGMQVAVVDVEDIYDEFSYGAHSAEAVKEFLAWTESHWQRTPHYALFVGDASIDPRNYLGYGNQDFVPTSMVDTGFLETASDDSLADFDSDGLAEMAVGRLPARTVVQAQTMIAKITGYVPGVSAQGALLIADHNDGYNFEQVSSEVQSRLPTGMPVTVINRGDNPTEQVRGQIIGGINQGPQVVNYVGHGSVEVWTGAGLLSSADAASLTNGNRLPLFISMTCLNGYFADVYTESLAEALMKAQGGGAVAAWASSGLTPPAAQSAMDERLIELLFGGTDSPMLGDAVRSAKTATDDRDVRRTWILFGDPTMRLR